MNLVKLYSSFSIQFRRHCNHVSNKESPLQTSYDHMANWNWNVKPNLHLSKCFYWFFSMLAITMNELEKLSITTQKCHWLWFVHTYAAWHHMFITSIWILKKRNKEKKGLCPCIWLHRLHTVTTWWTWLKWCTLSDMGRGRQRKIGGQFHVYKQTNKQNNSFSEISYLCFPPNKLDNFLTAFCAVTLGSVLGWLLATGRAEGVLSWLEWRHKPVTMII